MRSAANSQISEILTHVFFEYFASNKMHYLFFFPPRATSSDTISALMDFLWYRYPRTKTRGRVSTSSTKLKGMATQARQLSISCFTRSRSQVNKIIPVAHIRTPDSWPCAPHSSYPCPLQLATTWRAWLFGLSLKASTPASILLHLTSMMLRRPRMGGLRC